MGKRISLNVNTQETLHKDMAKALDLGLPIFVNLMQTERPFVALLTLRLVYRAILSFVDNCDDKEVNSEVMNNAVETALAYVRTTYNGEGSHLLEQISKASWAEA